MLYQETISRGRPKALCYEDICLQEAQADYLLLHRFDGSPVSQERPLPYHKLNDDMERQTLDAGFEKALGPKTFRRGAANAANGNASDAVRDQMMRHDPRWATFNGAYINEKVQFHLERVVAGEPIDDCLIDLFTHMSLTRDPQARRDMVPDEVWRDMGADPEILDLEA
ncbi:FluG domain-containing protein [Hirsutella rhossiliensis]|uniref:FluG domain-containing protein n=1 Tax=Hirsutella rhossiliensis TaxID=111463 RepID=A0A9P8N9Q3_9HYPO|nr:FluG domain-containing protein [Hirsutella rhossiliensis]KAH0967197.1 FluG domain-containing protein [Hirsutella rhossiliensis]